MQVYLALGVGVLAVAHAVVGLESTHCNFCVSGPVHGPLVDVGRANDDVLHGTHISCSALGICLHEIPCTSQALNARHRPQMQITPNIGIAPLLLLCRHAIKSSGFCMPASCSC